MDTLFIHYETIMPKKYWESKTKMFKSPAPKYFNCEKF